MTKSVLYVILTLTLEDDTSLTTSFQEDLRTVSFTDAVFVGDLDEHVTEPELLSVFRSCGPIRYVVIKRDKITKRRQQGN